MHGRGAQNCFLLAFRLQQPPRNAIGASDWTFRSPHPPFETPWKALRHNQFLPIKRTVVSGTTALQFQDSIIHSDRDSISHSAQYGYQCPSQHFLPTAAPNLTSSIFVQTTARSGVRILFMGGCSVTRTGETPAGCTLWGRSKFSGVPS